MATSYEHLLAPGAIGTMALRNRIVMAPMGDHLAHEDGTVSDELHAYAVERARGGAGLVMLGSVAVVHPVGCSNRCQTGIGEAHVPGLARLADAVHAEGARFAVQLTHAGKVSLNDMIAGRPLWVPSRPGRGRPDPLMAQMTAAEVAKQRAEMSSPTFRFDLHEITPDDVLVIVDWFASAVERARDAGIDGCELHAGHGYLLDEFLSPHTNHRTDDYGGPLENRARLLVEVLEGVRARVGADYPVWVRLNGQEFFVDDGTTVDDAVATARLAVAAGADAVHVSAYADPDRAIGFTESHTTDVPGHLVRFARAVKAAVDVPVITVGRIPPAEADRLLAEGAADFVAMGRLLLADADLPRKLAEGRADEVRPCVYHYRCISQIFQREGVRCAVNAGVGREDELRVEPVAEARRVLVVGGGPAGMEAARLAALRGHDVVLAEAADRLGGRFAKAAATHEPNADLLSWLERRVVALGVDVRLTTPVDAEVVHAFAPDVVVVAVGGDWARPQVAGGELAHVLTVDQLDGWLLDGEPLPGSRVVVLGGGRAGLGLADLAHRQGHEVVVVEPGPVFAPELGLPGRWRLIHDLQERGVELLASAELVCIGPDVVDVVVGDDHHELVADVVLVAGGVQPRPELAEALVAAGVEVHAVGDCLAPGAIEGAMRDAAELAVTL